MIYNISADVEKREKSSPWVDGFLFICNVPVPETITRLIAEDIEIGLENAYEVLVQSSSLGMIVNPDEDDKDD